MMTKNQAMCLSFVLLACEPRHSQTAMEPNNPTQESTTRPERSALFDDEVQEGPSPAELCFGKENRDGQWAPEAERQIRQAMDSQAGASLKEVECRATLCKIVVHVEPMAGPWDVGYRQALIDSGFSIHRTNETVVGSPEEGTVIIYQTRSGYRTPRPDGTPQPWPDDPNAD